MNPLILHDEEWMRERFDLTKTEMPDLAEAYCGAAKDAVYSQGALDVKPSG